MDQSDPRTADHGFARVAAALGRPVVDVLADAAAASRAYLRTDPA